MPRIIAVEDPSDIAEAKGELVPEGSYWDVLIEDCKDAQSKSSGDDMYRIRLRILDEGEAHNRVLFANIMQTYKARYSLIQLNKSIGLQVTGENGGAEGLYVGDPQEYIGQHTAIRIKHKAGDFPIDITYLTQTGSGSTLSAANGGSAGPSPIKASGRVPMRGRGGAAPLAAVPAAAEEPAPVDA